MGINRHQPRTATLWTLAIVIIIADQLSKAWFVFKLGNLHHYKTFAEFLPHYLGEFNRSLNPNSSIISEKYYSMMGSHDIVVWDPWIRFWLTTNQGAAWSMFNGNSLLLSGVSLAIATLLWFVWRRNFVYHAGMTIAVGSIIGGALGNFIDRFRLHEVVDFIAVRIPYIGRIFPKLGDPYNFPIFNVADSCAVCGTLALAGYLLWLDMTAGKRKKQQQDKLNSAFRPFDAPDPERIQRAQNVDTSKVKPWNQSERAQADEQEEVSRDHADQIVEDEVKSQLPELTNNYEPTASAIEEMKAENEDEDVIV
jgi:signal peptidase II